MSSAVARKPPRSSKKGSLWSGRAAADLINCWADAKAVETSLCSCVTLFSAFREPVSSFALVVTLNATIVRIAAIVTIWWTVNVRSAEVFDKVSTYYRGQGCSSVRGKYVLLEVLLVLVSSNGLPLSSTMMVCASPSGSSTSSSTCQ